MTYTKEMFSKSEVIYTHENMVIDDLHILQELDRVITISRVTFTYKNSNSDSSYVWSINTTDYQPESYIPGNWDDTLLCTNFHSSPSSVSAAIAELNV